MPVLTAIDVLGVQRFIFSSNRLRDMVAGSYLVHRSTTREGALEDLVPREKILLAGGGNALVEFDSAEKARNSRPAIPAACMTMRTAWKPR